jgi:hypothetical protein
MAYTVPYDQDLEREKELTRQIQYLYRKLTEFVPSPTWIEVRRTAHDVFVAVRGYFPQQTLDQIGRKIFPGFENRQYWGADGLLWAHFGHNVFRAPDGTYY